VKARLKSAVHQSDVNTTKYVKSENIKQYVNIIVNKFKDRSYTNTKVLDNTASYIHDMFSQYSNNTRYQSYELDNFEQEGVHKYRNVLADFKGRMGCDDGLVVVGAHYDTFAGYPGANDNTSGVAALLELARVLHDNPPKCDTQLVAYTLEEPPAFSTEKMGSYIHAKDLYDRGIKVKVAIVLETIGFYTDKANSQTYPIPLLNLYYPSEANFVSVVSNLSSIPQTRAVKNALKRTSNLPAYSISAPSLVPGVDFSDHRNYWTFGYPSVMITDTAFYRSDNYHTPNDTPESLNYNDIAKVADGIFEMLK